jgi:phosphopentomutase
MKPEWLVGRVIARPFIGKKVGEFERTPNRHDYAVKPSSKTVLNTLKEANYDVISVGKINDIFVGEGITESNRSQSSVHGMQQTIEIAKRDFSGLCFVNLVDFDAKWGHRRNPQGYATELEKFDELLADLIKVLKDDDLVIITADHGNDPTWTGSDHTREMVPLLMYSKSMKGTGLLNTTNTFSDLGATIADNFNVENPGYGDSLLNKLI